MTILRLHLGSLLPVDGRLEISGAEHRYLSRVRRARSGEPVEVLNGCGRRWLGIVERIGAERTLLAGLVEQPPVVTTPLVLGVGIGRMTALVHTVRAAAELAVDQVVPLVCQRSLSRGGALVAAPARLRRVAAEALRAGGVGRAPRIADPVALDEWCAKLPPPALKLALDISGEPLRDLVASHRNAGTSSWVLAVGPQGGFSEAELEKLVAAGFVLASLANLPLRVETAAIGAMALIRALVG